MRALLPSILALSLLLLFVPYANASGPVCEDERNGCWCGPYTWHAGGPEQGVGTTEQGSVQLATGAGWYVFVDSPHSILLDDGLFSVWLYPEANGMPGAQRGDETCDDCDGGARCDADVILP